MLVPLVVEWRNTGRVHVYITCGWTSPPTLSLIQYSSRAVMALYHSWKRLKTYNPTCHRGKLLKTWYFAQVFLLDTCSHVGLARASASLRLFFCGQNDGLQWNISMVFFKVALKNHGFLWLYIHDHTCTDSVYRPENDLVFNDSEMPLEESTNICIFMIWQHHRGNWSRETGHVGASWSIHVSIC